MIIGVTGFNASGKGEFCKYLATKGFIVYSLSDILREELQKQGKNINVENLIAKGNELRHEYGNSILADRTLKKIKPENNYVIDSIRNPAEINALKQNKDFHLVFIEAPPIEIRFERVKKRSREGETLNFGDFKREEEKQLENPDPASQQLLKCREMSDFIIHNDSALENLYKKIDELIEGLM